MVFFGDKTKAFIDLWSFEHFISGFATVIVVQFLCRKLLPHVYTGNAISESDKRTLMVMAFIPLVFFWEAFEFYMEAGYSNIPAVTYWFQGVEHWSNRLISDPVITTFGGYLGLRYQRLAIYARIISLTWLGVHVFVFPHCMYLQHEILGL